MQLLVDGSDANTAKLTQAYAGQVVNAFVSSTAGATRATPVAADVRLWFNPGRISKKFYGPGIFVLGLSMFPPRCWRQLAMSKEGEQKTILQVYVSNVSAHEFLLGKILAFMIVTFGEFLIAMFLMYTYFGLQVVGDPTPRRCWLQRFSMRSVSRALGTWWAPRFRIRRRRFRRWLWAGFCWCSCCRV